MYTFSHNDDKLAPQDKYNDINNRVHTKITASYILIMLLPATRPNEE